MALLKNNLQKKFSTIPNDIIIDKNLCANAKLVYIYLASKPDNWEVFNKDIQKNLGIKRAETLAKYWKELIANGWIERTNKIDDKGHFIGGFDYTIYGFPVIRSDRNPIEPNTEKNRTLNNTNIPIRLNNSNTDNNKNVPFSDNPQLNSSVIVAKHLLGNILSVKPNFKMTDNKLLAWEKDILLAIEKDGRTEKELIACIDYIYSTGTFWIPNIMSGKKLREKFDTIEMQMMANQSKSNQNASVVNATMDAMAQGVAV